jgi:hypothetical protein
MSVTIQTQVEYVEVDEPSPPDGTKQADLEARVERLESRFAVLKKSLVKQENKQKVIESYERLLDVLKSEVKLIERNGPSMVPEIDFNLVRDNGAVYPHRTRSAYIN